MLRQSVPIYDHAPSFGSKVIRISASGRIVEFELEIGNRRPPGGLFPRPGLLGRGAAVESHSQVDPFIHVLPMGDMARVRPCGVRLVDLQAHQLAWKDSIDTDFGSISHGGNSVRKFRISEEPGVLASASGVNENIHPGRALDAAASRGCVPRPQPATTSPTKSDPVRPNGQGTRAPRCRLDPSGVPAAVRSQRKLNRQGLPSEAESSDHGGRQNIRFCTSPDGTRIAIASIGSGPPLVRAAHWLSHVEYDLESPVWRPWLAQMSRDHCYIRYDQRGCGLSDRQVATCRSRPGSAISRRWSTRSG